MLDILDSASNLRAALLRREFSARDLLGSTLAAIERLDPALNAIAQKDAASACRAANDSDARIARGEARPLEGLDDQGLFRGCGHGDLRGRSRAAKLYPET
jgi:amidase